MRETREPDTVRLEVLGLGAPGLSIPVPGRARFEREFEDLKGDVTFQLVGLDHKVTEWVVRLQPGSVTLIRAPSTPVVQLSTNEEEWQE